MAQVNDILEERVLFVAVHVELSINKFVVVATQSFSIDQSEHLAFIQDIRFFNTHISLILLLVIFEQIANNS